MRFIYLLAVVVGSLGAQPVVVELFPDGAPGTPGKFSEEVWNERGTGYVDRSVKNVHHPTIAVYRPVADIASGAAVIVCPGGGYSHLAIDKEGHDVAKWMQSLGVAGIVLKYRLPNTDGAGYSLETPLDDVRQAIRIVRERADEWGIDRDNVGVMGFSAGGDLAARASMRFDAGEAAEMAPNFTILGYTTLREAIEIKKATPPAFMVHADDDRVDSRHSVNYYLALKDAGISAELHVYSEGGHGYGLLNNGLPISGWSLRLKDWMGRQGIIRR